MILTSDGWETEVLYALASTHTAWSHHFRTALTLAIYLLTHSFCSPGHHFDGYPFSSHLICLYVLFICLTTLISFDESDFPFGVPALCFLTLTVPPALQPARLTVLSTATSQSLLTIGKT